MISILVLGGSYLQSYFVDIALSIGYNIHVLDMNPNCYLSNKEGIVFKPINISDFELVNEYFIKNKCDLIISPTTEIGNIIAAKVAEVHGLKYNSVKTVQCSTDKIKMREALVGSSLKEPFVFKFRKLSEVPKKINYPFIIKPPVSSASRGVTLVRTEKELHKAIKRVETYLKPNEQILLEEYILGEQYSIETISFNGNHKIIAITNEILSGSPYFMERIDIISSSENYKLFPIINNFVQVLLDAVDVEFGPCHIEVKVNDQEVRLIEIATRSGLLRDRLISTAKGSNYNKLIIDSYLELEPKDSEIFLPKTNSLLGMIAYKEDIIMFNEINSKNLVSHHHFNENDLVENPTMLTDAIGYFFMESQNIDELHKVKLKL